MSERALKFSPDRISRDLDSTSFPLLFYHFFSSSFGGVILPNTMVSPAVDLIQAAVSTELLGP